MFLTYNSKLKNTNLWNKWKGSPESLNFPHERLFWNVLYQTENIWEGRCFTVVLNSHPVWSLGNPALAPLRGEGRMPCYLGEGDPTDATLPYLGPKGLGAISLPPVRGNLGWWSRRKFVTGSQGNQGYQPLQTDPQQQGIGSGLLWRWVAYWFCLKSSL